MKIHKVIINKAQCLKCKDIVESTHRHDFVNCKCGEIFVDGGKDYLRRGAKNFKNFKDLSETKEEEWTPPKTGSKKKILKKAFKMAKEIHEDT